MSNVKKYCRECEWGIHEGSPKTDPDRAMIEHAIETRHPVESADAPNRG